MDCYYVTPMWLPVADKQGYISDSLKILSSDAGYELTPLDYGSVKKYKGIEED